MAFELEDFYHDHLDLAYTSVDRIYLRGYIPILQSCGGLRTWSEQLRPDEPVSQSWLRSLAREFHDNVKKFASEQNIPLVKAQKGQRKHLVADEYRAKFTGEEGVYLILTGFESGTEYSSKEPRKPRRSHKHRNLSKRQGFFTHYYFYILDRLWGPICVVLASHPPFNVKVFLNAHHWVEYQAKTQGLQFDKLDNAFLSAENAAEKLQQIADSLTEGDIRRVADRWTYRVLPILTPEQRYETRFHYQWSISQMEVCHNLVFRQEYPLAQLFQRHIDLNRRFFHPNSIATVFGAKKATRPGDSTLAVFRTWSSRTVLRIKHHTTVIKQYDKHDRILRTECVCNNPRRFGVGKLLTNFHELRERITASLERFQHLQQAVVDSTLDRGELAALAQTSELGKSSVPGIRLDNERMMTVLHLLGQLATDPRGFAPAQLRELYSKETNLPYSGYQATYDLRKLRAKGFINRISGTRRYILTPQGTCLTVLLDKLRYLVFGPTIASAADFPSCPPNPPDKPRGPSPEPVPIEQLRPLLYQHAGNVSAVAREMKRQRCVVIRWIEREGIDLQEFRIPVSRPDIEEVYSDVSSALTRLLNSVELHATA